jgi:hypothetical protein
VASSVGGGLVAAVGEAMLLVAYHGLKEWKYCGVNVMVPGFTAGSLGRNRGPFKSVTKRECSTGTCFRLASSRERDDILTLLYNALITYLA